MGKLKIWAIESGDRKAVLLLLIISATATGWARALGMSWTPSDTTLWIMPTAFTLAFLAYRRSRPEHEGPAEIFLYSALWLIFPMYGAQLSYLVVTLEYPLQDSMFLHSDRILGFDWYHWKDMTTSNPIFSDITFIVYYSYYVLPYIVMASIAIGRMRGRNANFFIASGIALLLTIAGNAFVPAVGPAASGSPWVEIIENVRAGRWTELPYVGIITFPSYHTAMALLATFAVRGMGKLLWPIGIWSGGIVLSVPYWGAHYLTDVLGGICIAVAAQSIIGWRGDDHRPQEPGRLVPTQISAQMVDTTYP